MNESRTGISRRGAIRAGTAAAGAALLGGVAPIWAYAEPNGAGEDGAPSSDSRFEGKFRAAEQTMALAVETSYNGWPVGTPASAIGVTSYQVPGSSVSLAVRSGDVATVMIHVAARFHAEVEALRAGQVGGYSYRRNVNNPSVWSNHASGTAMDLNWNLHPNGSKGTFSAGQVSAIRNILAFTGPVIFWGGDYRGTTDEMHFEINVGPGDSRLTALASRITGAVSPSRVAFRSVANGRYVVAENGGVSPLIANRTGVDVWERFYLVGRGGNDVALRAEVNGRYVCAENGGAGPLLTNRDAVDTWETFELIRNGNGTVSLRSRANNRFVVAENAGASELAVNRSAISTWEQFEMIGV